MDDDDRFTFAELLAQAQAAQQEACSCVGCRIEAGTAAGIERWLDRHRDEVTSAIVARLTGG